jgi:hypothetical protein
MLLGDSLHLVYFLFFRSVLTRAELEALPLDNHLKEDVARGKVGGSHHSSSVRLNQFFHPQPFTNHSNQSPAFVLVSGFWIRIRILWF